MELLRSIPPDADAEADKDEISTVKILRVTEEGSSSLDDVVAREFPLTITLNNRELVTMLCSPARLKELAIGFLFSEGLLTSRDELKSVTVDERRGIARVLTTGEEADGESVFKRFITSGCGRGTSFYSAVDVNGEKVKSDLRISAGQVLALAKEFQQRSEVYLATHGVHSAALCDKDGILLFSEDIGRHNALDKIFGECFLEDISTADRLIITSGRISSEILLKVARRQVPVIISKSAPTDLGIRLADGLGITLLGFVRGKRINAYANQFRVTPS
jgi:FdhD protein